MSLVLAAMFSICLSECEQAGIRWSWGDNDGTQDFADYETPDMFLQHYVDILGSFRTQETGDMLIEGFVDPTGASAKGGAALLFWDFAQVASGSKSGNINDLAPAVTVTATVYCYKYFRYQWKLETDDYYFKARLRFRVQPPGYSTLFTVGIDWSDTCQVSGCTDLAYSRELYACQPPPTFSPSPSLTLSPSPSPTWSKSPSPTESGSQTPSPTATISHTPLPTPTVSRTPSETPSSFFSESSVLTVSASVVSTEFRATSILRVSNRYDLSESTIETNLIGLGSVKFSDTSGLNNSDVYHASQPFFGGVSIHFEPTELLEGTGRLPKSGEFVETLRFNFSDGLNQSHHPHPSKPVLATLVDAESDIEPTAQQPGPSANGSASAQLSDSPVLLQSPFSKSLSFRSAFIGQSRPFVSGSNLGRSGSFTASRSLRGSVRHVGTSVAFSGSLPLVVTRRLLFSVGGISDKFQESVIVRSSVMRGSKEFVGGVKDDSGSSILGGLGLVPLLGIAFGVLLVIAVLVVIVVKRRTKGSIPDTSEQDDAELNVESLRASSWEANRLELFGNTSLNALTTFGQHETLWATDAGATFFDDPFENAGFISFSAH